MAQLVGASMLLLCFSKPLPNQSGPQALLVRASSQPSGPSGAVDQGSSKEFVIVATKRAEVALLVGIFVSHLLPNEAGRSGTVGRVFLCPQSCPYQAGQGRSFRSLVDMLLDPLWHEEALVSMIFVPRCTRSVYLLFLTSYTLASFIL